MTDIGYRSGQQLRTAVLILLMASFIIIFAVNRLQRWQRVPEHRHAPGR